MEYVIRRATLEDRAALERLIAESARGADVRLLEVGDECGEIDVFPAHRHVDERRDECLAVLRAQRSALVAVVRDGSTVMDWLDTPRSC